MDDFLEEAISRRTNKGLYMLLYLLVWLFIVFFAGMALFCFFWVTYAFSILPLLGLLIAGGLTYFLFIYKDMLRTEYEYTLTNGEMDFAKVMGNSRRKQLLTLRLIEVEAGAPVSSASFARYEQMAGIKKLDYTINSDADKYFLYYVQSGNKTLLILEPSKKMLELMFKYSRLLERA